MRLEQHRLRVPTEGPGLYEITTEVATWVARQGISRGLLTAFLPHTSASLLIQENADPDVRADLERFFDSLVPESDRLYRHAAEGPDDMPAHQGGADPSAALHPGRGPEPRPRHLAGHLSLRTPPRTACPPGEPDLDRRLSEYGAGLAGRALLTKS